MTQGFLFVLYWWILIVAIGWIALPLARRFFKSYPDRGYILSKSLGLCLACFVNWLICSLHLIPFSRATILLALTSVACASFFLRSESWKELAAFLKNERKLVLYTELTFLICLLFFGFIRMNNPDIASTEKMPDYAFLTGILHSDYFPPRDPWYAGETINYFYYGHYQIAFLTKLSGISPEFTFNLGITFLFAITFLTAMGVTYGLIKRLKYALLGGSFVALIGNLDGINQTLNQLSKVVFSNAQFYPFNWFNWWMSSRVIVREGVDITINEFPFWSYILGDLHAHVNVVPFSLLVLSIILEFLRSNKDGFGTMGRVKESIFRLIIAAIALGAIPASNTWDTPTYFGLMTLGFIYSRQLFLGIPAKSFGMFLLAPVIEIFHHLHVAKLDSASPYGSTSLKRMIGFGSIILLLVISSVVLYLPFHLNFKPSGTQGVHLVDAIQRTLAGDFLTIYGFFFFCMVSFTVAMLIPKFGAFPTRLRGLIAGMFGMIFLMTFAIFGTFMVAFCITFLIAILILPIPATGDDRREMFFAMSLIFTVLVILLGCEFFYIKDAYGKTLERQNTIFKFYYQAWIFCGIASAYSIYWIREHVRGVWTHAWDSIYRVLFICTFAFPVIGTTVKCAHFEGLTGKSSYAKATMEGIWYMSWRYKGDYQAIQYLMKNASPKERILEATGPAFSHYGRLSAATGMDTILGWANHENIWRDGTWKLVTQRSNDMKEIYTTDNEHRARELMKTYEITYVYYGILEREQYPDAKFEKFGKFMKKVLEINDSDNKTSYLYRLP